MLQSPRQDVSGKITLFSAVPNFCCCASSCLVNWKEQDSWGWENGDHNEIIVSVARETKTVLAEIKTKLQSLSTKDKKLTRQLQVLDKKLKMKLDLVNKSNVELSLQIQVMSHKLQTILDKQGINNL